MNSNFLSCLDPSSKNVVVDSVISGLAALGTIAIAILAIWGDRVRAWLAPARLIIRIHDPEGDLTHFSDALGHPVPPPNRVYYYHLIVINERPWICPKNCCVLLKGMTKRGPDGHFHPVKMPVPLQFVWAPKEISDRLVPIQKEQVLDFGRVPETDHRFVPTLYSMSNNFQGHVGPNEAIRYSLEIVSDGYVSRKPQVFEVAFDGIWSPDLLQMQMHLKIREIREV